MNTMCSRGEKEGEKVENGHTAGVLGRNDSRLAFTIFRWGLSPELNIDGVN